MSLAHGFTQTQNVLGQGTKLIDKAVGENHSFHVCGLYDESGIFILHKVREKLERME